MRINQVCFSRRELVRYQQEAKWVSGQAYVLVMAWLAPAGAPPYDYALLPESCRDGLSCLPFSEANLRLRKTTSDLEWIITQETDETVSLYSVARQRYLTLSAQGASLSRKKFLLKVLQNGCLWSFSVVDGGRELFLRAAGREESPTGLCFTSGDSRQCSSFAFLIRKTGLSVQNFGRPHTTLGTFADIHVDYGLQLRKPYIRKTAIQAARGYRRRFDLDGVLLCGDNTSDNGSAPVFSVGGAKHGKWPYKRFLLSRNALLKTIASSFRRPENAGNVFYISGNHDYQCGDRQPEGQTYNSAYYSDVLPADIRFPLTEEFPVDQGSCQNLLCYEYKIHSCWILCLCCPAYPPFWDERRQMKERPSPAHDFRQMQWLTDRLAEIRKKDGENAIIFVTSHFPLLAECFYSPKYEINNLDVYAEMIQQMNRFPNLFYFYGHVHGGDRWVVKKSTGETMATHSPVALSCETENGKKRLVTVDSPDRGKFASDVILSLGFHECYAGSIAFYETSYFQNNGTSYNSWLSSLEVPFCQGCAIEVYEDRVVLTMQNFGKARDLADHVPGSSYYLKPMVYPLKK